jgi:hypothetical protein
LLWHVPKSRLVNVEQTCSWGSTALGAARLAAAASRATLRSRRACSTAYQVRWQASDPVPQDLLLFGVVLLGLQMQIACRLLLLLCSCEHRRRCALLLLLLLLGREGGPDCGRLLWRFLFVLAELPIHLLAGGQQPATACVSRSTRGSTCGSSHK